MVTDKKEATAELEQLVEPAMLRSHHVELIFFRWPFMTEEYLRKVHINDGYSPKHIAHMLETYGKIMEQNHPFIIVPAIDDICRDCNFNLDNALGCSRPIPEDVSFQNDLVMQYGIRQGEPYIPIDIIRKILEKSGRISLGIGNKEQYRFIYERLKTTGVS